MAPLKQLDEVELIEGWLEWKEVCAFAKCKSAGATIQLLDNIYQKLLRQYAHVAHRIHTLEYTKGYEAFETYAYLHHSKEGKCYKDRLFEEAASAPNPLQSLNGQAKYYLRSSVTNILSSKEYKLQTKQIAGDAPKGQEQESSLSVLDSLGRGDLVQEEGFTIQNMVDAFSCNSMLSFWSDNADECAIFREYQKQIHRIIENHYKKLSTEDLLILALLLLSIRTTSAEAVKITGKRTSTLADYQKRLFHNSPLFSEIKVLIIDAQESNSQDGHIIAKTVLDSIGTALSFEINSKNSENRLKDFSSVCRKLIHHFSEILDTTQCSAEQKEV